MKKVMFAMAALAAGVTLADVASQNIVGYQTQELTAGKNKVMIGVQFKNVSGGDFQLSDLVVKRKDDGSVGDGETNIRIWNPKAARYSSEIKYWANPYTDATKTDKVGAPAWGDENMVLTNLTIAAGDSVWLKPGVGTGQAARCPVFTIAGEVFNPGSDVQYYTWESTAAKTKLMVSNPFPCDLDIADILVYRKDDISNVGDGETQIQIWDAKKVKNSAPIKYWANPYTDATKTAKLGYAAWGDEDMVVTNVTISAGVGFWLKPGVGTTQAARRPVIRFANPFYTGSAE